LNPADTNTRFHTAILIFLVVGIACVNARADSGAVETIGSDTSLSTGVARKYAWGVGTSIGGLVGLEVVGNRGGRWPSGFEGSLWLSTGARTRAIGLDVGWNTQTIYSEIQAAFGLRSWHDGELLAGIALGPVREHGKGANHVGSEFSAWVALVPLPLFPYVRVEKVSTSPATFSLGLMMKVVVPLYGHY
jgi:hypothetical protein